MSQHLRFYFTAPILVNTSKTSVISHCSTILPLDILYRSADLADICLPVGLTGANANIPL